MAHQDSTIGRMFGNVRITASIGRGAMGVVYKGFHERMGRDVAVKMLIDNGRKNARERFLREARACAKVRHANVVQILDAGEDHGCAYLVMELVEGHSLGSIVDDTGAMAPAVVAKLAIGIARGLAAIHDCNIIHRDIKPDNILVGTDGVAKITDLGLAKQNDDPELLRLTATGVVVGTPLYVSPEAIRDPKAITAATDIYSLGASLYHLLAGKPPFDSESSYEVMRAQLEARPRPLREINPEIPAGLAQLVEQCLEKQASRRPSAKQLADLLDQGARVQPGANRGLITAIILAVVIVLALAVGAWRLLGRQPDVQVKPPADAALTVRSSHAPAKIRVDHGPWQTLNDGPLPLPAGQHRIEVVCDRPGPLLSWRGEVTLEAQRTQELTAALAATPVADVRVQAPGPGMIYVDGVAYGREQEVLLHHAGTFAIGSWSGAAWTSLTATIDAGGTLVTTKPITGDRPQGSAWWCSRDDDGRPLDAHHVVCWWEAEQLRASNPSPLPEPREWIEQGNRPAQAATRIPPPLLHALRLRITERGMRLPPGDIARRLAVTYRAGIWSADGERPDVVGGTAATALLVVVPRLAN